MKFVAKLAVLLSIIEAVPLVVWLVPYSNPFKRRIVVFLSQTKYARWGSIAGLVALIYHSVKLFRLALLDDSTSGSDGSDDQSTTSVSREGVGDDAARRADFARRLERIEHTPIKDPETRSPITPQASKSEDIAGNGGGSAHAASPLRALPVAQYETPPPMPASETAPATRKSAASPSWLVQAYQHVLGILLGLFARRVMWLLKGNEEALFQMEQNAVERDILTFKPPSVRKLETVLKPYAMALRPKFLGMEQIPTDRPILFVSNHTIMGFDYPLLLTELYRKKGIFLRVLADHSHFQIPINADILQNVLGAVDGTRRNAGLLMGMFVSACIYC